MPILLKYKDIDGESKIQGFEKYIELLSCSLGTSRNLTSSRGTSTREGTTATLSDITVAKESDGTTLKFFQESLIGKMDRTVEIAFLRTGEEQPVPYLRIELEGAGVSSFQQSSGGDRPNEVMSFSFDKITMYYNPMGDGLSGNEGNFGYDLAKTAKV